MVLFIITLREKCPYSEFSDSYFPAFGLNTEIYRVNLRIQFECGKIRTRKTPNTGPLYVVLVIGQPFVVINKI